MSATLYFSLLHYGFKMLNSPLTEISNFHIFDFTIAKLQNMSNISKTLISTFFKLVRMFDDFS